MKLLALTVVALASSLSLALTNSTSFDWEKHPALAKSEKGKANCFAAVVGPKVALIPEHCAGNGNAKLSLSFFTGDTIEATVAEALSQDSQMVAAGLGQGLKILLLEHEVPETVKPVSVLSRLFVGQNVQLVASGRRPAEDTAKSTEFGEGKSSIVGYGFGSDPKTAPYSFVTNNGAVCYFGDSGGMVLTQYGTLMGLIVAGDMKSNCIVSSLESPLAIKRMQEFARSQQVKVCGINANCP